MEVPKGIGLRKYIQDNKPESPSLSEKDIKDFLSDLCESSEKHTERQMRITGACAKAMFPDSAEFSKLDDKSLYLFEY